MSRPHLRPDGFPTRSDMSLISVEERAIMELVWEIEKLGASPALTRTVILLGEARDALADHIEGREVVS